MASVKITGTGGKRVAEYDSMGRNLRKKTQKTGAEMLRVGEGKRGWSPSGLDYSPSKFTRGLVRGGY